MWIRFWYKGNYRGGGGKEESSYEWYDIVPSNDLLEDESMSRVPSYIENLEGGYKYGFEENVILPDEIRKFKIRSYENSILRANKMLEILMFESIHND